MSEAIKELVKGSVVLAFTFTVCYLAAYKLQIDGNFLTLSAGVIGTYFGINIFDKKKSGELEALKAQNAVLVSQSFGKPTILPSKDNIAAS